MSEFSPSGKAINELVWMDMIRTLRWLMNHSGDERNRLAAIRALTNMEAVGIARDRETRLQMAAASGKASQSGTDSASTTTCTRHPHSTGRASGTQNSTGRASGTQSDAGNGKSTPAANCAPAANGAETAARFSYPPLDLCPPETAAKAEGVVAPTASDEPPLPAATELEFTEQFAEPTSQQCSPPELGQHDAATAVVAAPPKPSKPRLAPALPPVTIEVLVDGEYQSYPMVTDIDMELVEDADHYRRLTQLAADEWHREQAMQSGATLFRPIGSQPHRPQHQPIVKERASDAIETKGRPPPY